jgi:hypothetical protein
MERMIEEFEINGLVKDVYYGDFNHIVLLVNPGLEELDCQAG